jgi:hypothetical protein
MKRIFTPLTALVCLLAFNQKGFGQSATLLTNTQCNSVDFSDAESANFNDGSTTNMSGFSGGGWEKTIAGSNEYLSVQNGLSNVTYNLVSPTYTSFSPTSNLKFTIGGNAKVAQYVVTAETETGGDPIWLGAYSNGSAGVSGEQCLAIAGWNYSGRFRIKIGFTLADGAPGSGIITFDDFFLTKVVAAITLPVSFSSFNAKAASAGVALTWNVGLEESVSSYEVERSTDGKTFTKIGSVAANGQTSYSFTDTKSSSVSYYRIKSIDANGKITYSAIVSLKGGMSIVLLKAFMSNPTTLIVQHDAAQSGSRISISSADGRLIKTQVPSIGSQQTSVDLSSAITGLYLVRFDNGNGQTGTLKVMKQ